MQSTPVLIDIRRLRRRKGMVRVAITATSGLKLRLSIWSSILMTRRWALMSPCQSG